MGWMPFLMPANRNSLSFTFCESGMTSERKRLTSLLLCQFFLVSTAVEEYSGQDICD